MMAKGRTRVTVDLPPALVERADALVRRGAVRSRNRLIVQAVETYLDQLQQALIDAQFAEMAHDERYRDLSLEVAQAFSGADWEALRRVEGTQRG